MSLIFNHLPANVSRALAIRATQRHRTVEEVAIEALERGLAFSEETGGDEVGASWLEDPRFEKALSEFAQIDG